jgi:ribonuclease Z
VRFRAPLNHIFISTLAWRSFFGLVGVVPFALLGRTTGLHIYGPKDQADLFTASIVYNSWTSYGLFHELESNV